MLTTTSSSQPLNDNQTHLNDALARLIRLKTDYRQEWCDNNWYCSSTDGLLHYPMMTITFGRQRSYIEKRLGNRLLSFTHSRLPLPWISIWGPLSNMIRSLLSISFPTAISRWSYPFCCAQSARTGLFESVDSRKWIKHSLCSFANHRTRKRVKSKCVIPFCSMCLSMPENESENMRPSNGHCFGLLYRSSFPAKTNDRRIEWWTSTALSSSNRHSDQGRCIPTSQYASFHRTFLSAVDRQVSSDYFLRPTRNSHTTVNDRSCSIVCQTATDLREYRSIRLDQKAVWNDRPDQPWNSHGQSTSDWLSVQMSILVSHCLLSSSDQKQLRLYYETRRR